MNSEQLWYDVGMSNFADSNAPTSAPVVLKPHDVALLLKIIAVENSGDNRGGARSGSESFSVPPLRRIAEATGISLAEVHNSLGRARAVGLILSNGGLHVNRRGLLDLMTYGMRWVFPPSRGGLVRGIPTSYAAAPLADQLILGSDPPPVWAYAEGKERGIALSPLYPRAVEAALQDPAFYELLVLADALRSNETRARERNLAQTFLRERLDRTTTNAI